jgi:hypothetical protein
MVSEELPTEDALSGCRGVTDRISFFVAEKIDGGCPFWFQSSYQWRMPFLVHSPSVTPLKPERASSICNFSATRKNILSVTPLQPERSSSLVTPLKALRAFSVGNCREATDGRCPFWFQSSYQRGMTFLVSEEALRAFSVGNSSESIMGILRR